MVVAARVGLARLASLNKELGILGVNRTNWTLYRERWRRS